MSMSFLTLYPTCSVVKFRRTGDSTYSEYECGTRDQMVQVEGGNTDAGSVALSHGAPVPQEFANPTDGTLPLLF